MSSCQDQPERLVEIQGTQLPIDAEISAVAEIDSFVRPYRQRIDKVMDSVLAYAPATLAREDGRLDSSLGNLMADLVIEEAEPVFKERTGKEIDMVVMNYGGIRSILSQGPVTARRAYEIMPFENFIVVAQMKGQLVAEMLNFLAASNKAHPVAGLEMVVGPEGKPRVIRIQGKPLRAAETYYIATSDYLAKGGDQFKFFLSADSIHRTDYLLRNAMIDHFKHKDTLRATAEDRIRKMP